MLSLHSWDCNGTSGEQIAKGDLLSPVVFKVVDFSSVKIKCGYVPIDLGDVEQSFGNLDDNLLYLVLPEALEEAFLA